MKKTLLFCAIACTSICASAQVTPKVMPEVPINGNSYVLVNKVQTASQYMSRTSWDGAFYFQPEEASKWADYAFTAIDNGDGTWSFGIPSAEEEGYYDYLAFPLGSPNLNAKGMEPVMWKLDPKEGGFYHMILGDGNNPDAMVTANGYDSETPTKDLRMHLNRNADFFVVNYYGGPFFGDIYGEMKQIEDEARGCVIFEANDSTSFNWGFVSPENVPAYYNDLKASGTINNFYRNYCDIDDYADGFFKTFQTCADLYNSEEYKEEDIEAINNMIESKVALYKEIDAAIILNEDDNAALNAAINKAKESFNQTIDADVLTSAANALKEAETLYMKGNGDITGFGVNMSFEDLSAQGGNQSSGVAGAPTGWNVYINGKQATTASDVQTGGITAWHGVNSDSTGDVKDGNMSFGIWTSAVPQYEISQTIEDLTNGTYIISAGLMAGSNGNGSRLTTQRIFANENATYYAAEYEYNPSEFDNSEIYGFANNEILVTDQEMLPVSVKAYVYDGTLTFGVRTNGNIAAANRTEANGAGGDGWFKTDNFQIKSVGYVPEDAIALLEHYTQQLEEYTDYRMESSIAKQLDSDLNKYTGYNETSAQTDIDAAIVGAKNLFAVVDANVKAYQRLEAAIYLHEQYLDEYSNKAGAGLYADAIMEVTDKMEDCIYDEAGIDEAIALLEQALEDCKHSDTIEPGMDLTEYIKNPSFEDLSAQGNTSTGGVANAPKGWNIYIEGELCNTAGELNAAGVTAWCGINNGDNIDVVNTQGESVYTQYTDGDHLWGIWSGAIPVVEISQTIKGLPAGTYTLTADMVVQNDWAGMNLGTQRIFANEYVQMFGAESDYAQNSDETLFATFPDDVIGAAGIDKEYATAELKHLTYADNYSYESYGASSAPYPMQITFGLAENGDITFGARSSRISAVDGSLSTQASLGWLKIDNFRLTYDSADVPEGAGATDISTPVSSKQAMQFYNASGVRLSSPQKGINIIRMSDGTAVKVLVK